MESILKPFDLLEEQAGAGTGNWLPCSGPRLSAVTLIDGRQIGTIRSAGRDDCNAVISSTARAFKIWRTVPAPRRGEIVRQIGEALRLRKKELGALVSLETGKIRAEGEGEVQEMIDIADIELAVRAIVFGAVGTAGQRCTTTRRLIVHADIYERVAAELVNVYRQIKIGDPLEEAILMGPLIDTDATTALQAALTQVKDQGGRVLYGGTVLSGGLYDAGTYVTPCICEARADMPIVQAETFAPLLYLIKYETIEEAVAYHNAVPQGLSSAVFTREIRESEYFLSSRGSDCGIANVNIGTSGAEIGGAFGGEKETGGGRESGSDAWKAYMRRQTCTVNWSSELPLAQGISFTLG